MDTIEMIALENDLKKLVKHFNPQYVSIYRLPVKSNCSYCLKIVAHVPSYVVTSETQTVPRRVNQISFFVDILSGYPLKKPLIYYGEKRLHHVNVFRSNNSQCTDVWNSSDSDLTNIVEKTIRAIVYDPSVTRYDSKADPRPETESWMKEMERCGKLPTINPALLMARSTRRKPARVE